MSPSQAVYEHLRVALAFARELDAESITHVPHEEEEGDRPVMMGGPVPAATAGPPAMGGATREPGIDMTEVLIADQGVAMRRVVYHCTAALCAALGAGVPEVSE